MRNFRVIIVNFLFFLIGGQKALRGNLDIYCEQFGNEGGKEWAIKDILGVGLESWWNVEQGRVNNR